VNTNVNNVNRNQAVRRPNFPGNLFKNTKPPRFITKEKPPSLFFKKTPQFIIDATKKPNVDYIEKRSVVKKLEPENDETPSLDLKNFIEKKKQSNRQANEEANRRADEEANRKAKEEANKKAKEEANRKAKEEANRKAKEEANKKAKEEGQSEGERRNRKAIRIGKRRRKSTGR
jgi:flagellar biosynthesis/type III secretory pathway protein FliH